MIYFDDHEPMHVHVWKAGAVARLGIGDDHRSPAVLDPGNMPTHLLRNAVRIVEANQDQFITAWRNIHGA